MSRQDRRKTFDITLSRIEMYNAAHGGGVVVRKDARGYSLFREDNGDPVARLRPCRSGDLMEILWWSHRDRWEAIGAFGGVTLPLEEALDYIAEDPIGCFWN